MMVPMRSVCPTCQRPIAQHRATDTATSKVYAPGASTIAGRLLAHFALVGRHGWAPGAAVIGTRGQVTGDALRGSTSYEAGRASAGVTDAQAWRRCSDLSRNGYLVPMKNEDGTTAVRYTPSGDARRVLTITDAGRALVATWEDQTS